MMDFKNKGMMAKKCFLFISLFILSLSFVASVSYSDCDIYGNCKEDEVVEFNNATANVNASKYWNTNSLGALDDANTTQFENNGGTLSIMPSWLDGLYCSIFGCTMDGDIDMDSNDIINVGQLNTSDLYASSSIHIDSTIPTLYFDDSNDNDWRIKANSGFLSFYEVASAGNVLSLRPGGNAQFFYNVVVDGYVNIAENLNMGGNITLSNDSQIQDSGSDNAMYYVEVDGDVRLRVAG